MEALVQVLYILLEEYRQFAPEDIRSDADILFELLWASQFASITVYEGQTEWNLALQALIDPPDEASLRRLITEVIRMFHAQYN